MKKLPPDLRLVPPTGQTVTTDLPASAVAAQSRLNTSANKDVATYARLFRAARGQTVQRLLKEAAIVSEARDNLGKAGFRQLAKMLGMSHGTLSKFVTIHSQRDRFVGREQSLPGAWTVMYGLSKLTDGQYETIAASEKLRPELTEREVSKLVAQHDAADSAIGSAADELACMSVRIVFPALLSLQHEDAIKQKVFAALEDDETITIRVSERRKFRAGRR